MAAYATVLIPAAPAERAAEITVNFLTLGEEFINPVTKDVVDFRILGGDAAVEHRASAGLADDVLAAVCTPDRLVHASSTSAYFPRLLQSIRRGKIWELCLSCASSNLSQGADLFRVL